tara:strand:+ start:3238 stop:4944 length:1707 start_codon:yes stop_codon:yes gene_type:complete
LTDLIKKERDEYIENITEINSDNSKFNLRKKLAFIPSLALGGSVYYIFNESGHGAVGLFSGGICSFLSYQLLTNALQHTKNLGDLLKATKQKEMFNIFGKIIKNHLTEGEEIDFRRKYNKQISEKGFLQNKMNQSVFSAYDDNNYGSLLEVFEFANNNNIKKNFLERLIEKFVVSQHVKESLRHRDRSSLDNIVDAAEVYLMGFTREVHTFFKSAIKNSKNQEELLNTYCLFGSFLEKENYTDYSEIIFDKAIGNIKNVGGENFKEIEGSKNKIYVHKSDLIGGSFIFKTGEDSEEIVREYDKSRAISFLAGDSRKKFIRPLKLSNESNEIYSVTRRFGNFNLMDYINKNHNFEACEIMKKSLDELLILQIKSNKELSGLGNIFEKGDLRGELYYKIKPEIIDDMDFIFYDIDGCWKGIAHRDFHPGNILVDRGGEFCIIDFEKSKLDMTYVDPITLVENYYCRKIFNSFKDGMNLADIYGMNAFDSGMIDSQEESLRNVHLAGVIENLRLFKTSEKFAETNELEKVKAHHLGCSVNHLNKLESFYSGQKLVKLRDIGEKLGNMLYEA